MNLYNLSLLGISVVEDTVSEEEPADYTSYIIIAAVAAAAILIAVLCPFIIKKIKASRARRQAQKEAEAKRKQTMHKKKK